MAACTNLWILSLFCLSLLQLPGSASGEYCERGILVSRTYCIYGCCHEYTSDPCCAAPSYSYIWNVGVIVGVVIGSLVGLSILICLIVLCVRACIHRPAPVVYANTAMPPTTVVWNSGMTAGGAYPYPVQNPGQVAAPNMATTGFSSPPPYNVQGQPQYPPPQPNQWNAQDNPGATTKNAFAP